LTCDNYSVTIYIVHKENIMAGIRIGWQAKLWLLRTNISFITRQNFPITITIAQFDRLVSVLESTNPARFPCLRINYISGTSKNECVVLAIGSSARNAPVTWKVLESNPAMRTPETNLKDHVIRMQPLVVLAS
jgi:hypothetical protein